MWVACLCKCVVVVLLRGELDLDWGGRDEGMSAGDDENSTTPELDESCFGA